MHSEFWWQKCLQSFREIPLWFPTSFPSWYTTSLFFIFLNPQVANVINHSLQTSNKRMTHDEFYNLGNNSVFSLTYQDHDTIHHSDKQVLRYRFLFLYHFLETQVRCRKACSFHHNDIEDIDHMYLLPFHLL